MSALHDLTRVARNSLRERINHDPSDVITEDLELHPDLYDVLHEIADACIPIYNHTLAQLLADDPSLAEVDDPGILPEAPTVWQIIQIAIYERLESDLAEHADELADYLQDFAPAYVDTLRWLADSEIPEETDIDNESDIANDCARFIADAWTLLELASGAGVDAEEAARLFALSRNGEGAGFFDCDAIEDYALAGIRDTLIPYKVRDENTLGDALQRLAQGYPPASIDLYFPSGDDAEPMATYIAM